MGLLVPDGPVFRLHGEPWRYKGVSAFRLCARFSAGEDIDPFLASYPGFNTLRVWDYVTWPGTGWESATPEAWLAFLRYVGDRGWWVELTLLTDDDPGRIAPAARLALALSGAATWHQNLLLEAGNEPTTHKQIATHALRPMLEDSGLPYCSGDYEDSDRWYGTYYTCHTARTHDWPRRAHDLYDFYVGQGPDKPHPPQHVPCLGDEPGKVQDVGAVLADWRAYFGGCSIMGGGATFHSETGKHGLLPTLTERACAAAALEGLDAFPPSAPLAIGSYHRIAEPGQSPEARTYVVGDCAVRAQQAGTSFPEPGWLSLDPDGVLWTR